MARGRSLRHTNHQASPDEDGPFCPLCIEPLDAYEQTWLPCGCGYQVCAFCYGRLNLENNKQCPGCRQEYGSFGVVTSEEAPASVPLSVEELQQQPTPSDAGLNTAAEERTTESNADRQGGTNEIVKANSKEQPVSIGIVAASESQAAGGISSVSEPPLDVPHPQEASVLEGNPDAEDDDEEEEVVEESKPKIQPTKIKTRPWAVSDTGQPNPVGLPPSSNLPSSAWPLPGQDADQNGGSVQNVFQNGRTIPHPIAQNAKVSSTEASERLAAFLGEVAQKKQQQQQAATSSQGATTRSSSGALGQSQAAWPADRIIKAPPGYDQPLAHWGQNGRTQPPLAESAAPAPHQDRPVDLQAEKFAKWWQTVNTGARQRDSLDSGATERQAGPPHLPGNDSSNDLVRQAADAHGLGYPASSHSPNMYEEDNEKTYEPFPNNHYREPERERNDSKESLEKLYNIWPPHARSNSDSAGPSSLSSTHNMWAVHKQASGVSALWNPQPSEPIPDSLQELWANADKTSGQPAHSRPQISHAAGQERGAEVAAYQRNSYSPMPDQLSSLNPEHQMAQNVSIGFQAGGAFNRSQTQTPVSNGNLSGLGQSYGMRYMAGMSPNAGQATNTGFNQAQPNAAFNQAQLGPQNQPYGDASGMQAAQAYLQGLQLQAALSKQVSGNQQNLLQVQQDARFPAQTQVRAGFSQGMTGQGFGTNGLTGHTALSQHLNQNVANSNQTLGNLNISQAYANQLLGQLSLGNNQGLGGTANQTGNGLLANGRGAVQQQQQQYGLGNQVYGGGNTQLSALGGNVGLSNGNTDLNTLRLQQALQALNLQQNLGGTTLQNLQNLAAQERQRQLLDVWAKQQQQQQSQQNQVFPQQQALRQEQSRFANQFGVPPRSMGQQYHNLGQTPGHMLQQQHRLGRSGSPAGFQNPNVGNQMYQQ